MQAQSLMRVHSSPIRSGNSNHGTQHHQGELKDAICLEEERLFWISLRRMPLSFENPSSIFVFLDDQYIYEPFCHDFGPVNIGYTIKLCRHVDHLLKVSGGDLIIEVLLFTVDELSQLIINNVKDHCEENISSHKF